MKLSAIFPALLLLLEVSSSLSLTGARNGPGTAPYGQNRARHGQHGHEEEPASFPEASAQLPFGSAIRLRHSHSQLPGSSRGGKAMTWQHFEMLRKRDRERHRWLHSSANKHRGTDAAGERAEGRSDLAVVEGASFPLEGNADPTVSGLYWADMQLGSSKRSFAVQIDSGSDLLWVQCKPCTACPTRSQLVTLAEPFNPAESGTFSAPSCSSPTCYSLQSTQSQLGIGCNADSAGDDACYYQLKYGDGSISTGKLGKDFFTFNALNGTTVQVQMLFGCAFNQTGNLFASGQLVDGLVGLGRGSFSLPSQMLASKVLAGTFSHCLGGEEDGGGTLILGTPVSISGSGNLTFTPLAQAGSAPQYYLSVTGLKVSSTLLTGIDSSTFGSYATGQGTILDSGTTLAIVPDLVYNQLTQILAGSVTLELLPFSQTSNQYCWLFNGKTTSDLTSYFPTLTLDFDGDTSMNIPPENYMLIVLSTSGSSQAACFGWQSATETGLGITVLGDVVMRNKLVTYDIENAKVGWADFNCKTGTLRTANATIVVGSSGTKLGLSIFKIVASMLLAIVPILW